MKITKKAQKIASAHSSTVPNESEVRKYLRNIISDVNERAGVKILHLGQLTLQKESDSEYTVVCDVGHDIALELTLTYDNYGPSGRPEWHFSRDWEYEADDLLDYLQELDII